MIFPVIFMALYASHFTLLRLPYYWDEAGYYIPAAWDFFRTGSLIPTTTLSNAHPPLPSIYLALWWKTCGYYPRSDARSCAHGGLAGLLAVWRLAMRLVGRGFGRVLDGAADGNLSDLVRAELAGPGRHFCRRVLAVGTGVRAAQPRPQCPGLQRCGSPARRFARRLPSSFR
jgi:hypothetical protein